MVKVDPILPPLPKTSDSMKYSFWAGASSSGSPHTVPLPPVLSIIQLCSPQSHFIHPCNYLIYLYPQGPELNRSREPWARSQQSLPSPLGADFSCPHTFIRCVLRALTLHNDPFQQQLPPTPHYHHHSTAACDQCSQQHPKYWNQHILSVLSVVLKSTYHAVVL